MAPYRLVRDREFGSCSLPAAVSSHSRSAFTSAVMSIATTSFEMPPAFVSQLWRLRFIPAVGPASAAGMSCAWLPRSVASPAAAHASPWRVGYSIAKRMYSGRLLT